MRHRKLLLSSSLLASSLLASSLLLEAALPAFAAKDPPRSFSLATSRTFSPGESVKIQLFARNVPALEFRVYRVRDPQKFFSGLKDLHSFGAQSPSPAEQIDERTWIERLHDFKANLWRTVRHFFHSQFTDEARDSFREQQGKLGKRSQVVGATQFAQVPLLNESQLVARWRLETPPALVSETHQLPIDGLAAGVYLIEATEGTYKAYTVAIVTSIAIVERGENSRADVYVADRKTGAPIDKADVALWMGQQHQSSSQTSSDGLATLAMTARGANLPGANGGAEPENVWIIARHGADTAIATPWSYGFGGNERNDLAAYAYTDRPVYRPGHTVHIKGILRRKKDDTLILPEERTIAFQVTGPDNKEVFAKEVPVSAHGTVAIDLNLETDAALGYYSFGVKQNGAFADVGSFYVEEYKKPEYQVTVKPATPRVLQGNTIQATIEARYFFGEPVAGAKVTYVVHTSQHYWWDEDE
jgi:alpha-2-macroglobulin